MGQISRSDRLERWLGRASFLLQADIILAAAMIAVVWLGVGYHLSLLRGQAVASAAQNTANLARAFEGHASGIMRTLDGALLRARAAWERDPESFSPVGHEAAAALGNGAVARFAVVGPDGAPRQVDGGFQRPPKDWTLRLHFRQRAAEQGDALVLSGPIGGTDGVPIALVLSRRLISPDGTLGGFITATLDPRALSSIFSAEIGRDGHAFLVGDDGIVRAGTATGGASLGRAMAGTPEMPPLLASPEGTHVGRNPLDGVNRIVSHRRLPDLPLTIAVGVGERETLLAYERQKRAALAGCGNLTGLILLVSLLSARHRERVELTRRRLGATLENMSQGIMMVDARRRVVVSNGRAADMLGLPQLGASDVDFDDLLCAMVEAGQFAGCPGAAASWAAFADGVDFEHERPDGTVLEVRTATLPDGSAVRTFTDVTGARKAAGALAAARDEAEAASRARAGFLAMMSHEIRTPLNGVIGMAGLLLDSGLDGERLRHARVLRDSAEDLMRILNDILDFSKMDAAGIPLEEAPFEVEATVRSALDVLAARAAEKGVSISLSVAPGMPRRLLGDAGRLRQVLLNLASNAIKFTSVGSVSAALSARRLADGGWTLRTEVRDTGIGIPRESLGTLFREFSQVDASISRRFGGTGLGLAICRRLVERMGGAIGVESTDGSGSMFWFEIPLGEAHGVPDAAPDTAREPTNDAPVAGLRILLAEDSPANQMVATALLRRLGHRVDAVGNGLEAVEAVRAVPYDVVLMDVMMPEMDGLAATRAIRALPGDAARVPIVALTANAFASDEEECRAAGMDGFVTKPVTRAKLSAAVLRHGGAGAISVDK